VPDVFLRVNVDDAGLAPEVADAALELARARLPVSASVAAPGRTAVADARRLSAAGIPVGVHVVLTQERAMGGPGRLTDASGRLPRSVTSLIGRWLRGSFRAADAVREISLQIESLRDAGIRLDHLDGHEHVHALPFLRDAIPELARSHGIPRIRDVAALRAVTARRLGTRLALQWAGRRLRARSSARGLVPSAALWGFDVSGRLDSESLRRIIQRLVPGENELLTHPATRDLSEYTAWGYAWRREFESLIAFASSSELRRPGLRFDRSSER
jgi:predicted glycoside hydrolase/deacetylase ChbG (UPF0249 family)